MDKKQSSLSVDSIWKHYESEHEIAKTIKRFENFLIPKLRTLDLKRILEVGCSNGAGTIFLRSRGFEAYGVDPSLREDIGAQYPYLIRGKGEDLPFTDLQFELSFAFEVIEHVGNIDGMLQLRSDYASIREKFISEICRVTSDFVFIATPNKYFPIDEHNSDRSGKFGFRIHSPFEKCTLSVTDLEKYFNSNGYRLHSFLDPYGYYELERVKRKLGAIGVFLSRLFLSVSRHKFLGRTAFNPHLFLCFHRAEGLREF